ncbi:hypothetical protein K458DRAFT_412084 [Lentithecium fluviatile CBS 122367]|uniref:Uncharacterized protein n=1 Tax=Lentithecium fluviatile CBS 122367 TaxID=1168545 RepID=A0A6G1JKJ5_9PLEO|nr:hypothetical protein K458DRAFT_412084 [Lentithecium fluviatile CBS 122367]
MTRSRFRGNPSTLKPEWILEEAAIVATTSSADSVNDSTSHEETNEEDTTKREGETEAPNIAESQDTFSAVVSPIGTPRPARSKLKSRYAKSYTSTWTIPSCDNPKSQERVSKSQRPLRAEIHVSTDTPMVPPTPWSMVPPTPTKINFLADDVPPHSRWRRNENDGSPSRRFPSESVSAASPNSSGDAPPKAPYIASAYTPT